jgi:hypothetical protein
LALASTEVRVPDDVGLACLALLLRPGHRLGGKLQHSFHAGASHYINQFVRGQAALLDHPSIGKGACPLRTKNSASFCLPTLPRLSIV